MTLSPNLTVKLSIFVQQCSQVFIKQPNAPLF